MDADAFSQLLQLQFFQFAQVAEQFLVKSVTQPFSILKTEKTPGKILEKPKNDFFTKKSCHIIMNYDSPCMKMGGHFTITNLSKMNHLAATAS